MIGYIDIDNINVMEEAPFEEPDRQYYYMAKLKLWVLKKEEEYGRKLTACINTFGCQMNARDSEKLHGILEIVGFRVIEDEKADLVLYNTCTVRENANLKVYGHLGFMSNLKKKNPEKIICLCGCMMQEEVVVEKIKKSYRFVDLVFGTHNIYKFAELLYNSINQKKMVVDILPDAEKVVEDLPIERKYSFKSGVNIMFGCNNFCTYCIVPYVRGRERSRKPEDIIAEIKKLVLDGVVEIMLLGQNVNSYGKNLENKISFAQLLQQIEEIEGLQRIRFMTSHPKDLSDELIDVMAGSKKICRHIHLPVQSGSSRILKEMNRVYTKEDYLKLVEKIKAKLPEVSLTTDIIVGFPGETEEDFLETLDVVRKVQYDSAFTFIYSKRTGTKAATMDNQIDEETVKNRFDRLLKEVQDIAVKRTDRLVGEVQEVLVEDINNNIEGYVTGRLSNNSIVHFEGGKELIGKIVKVELVSAKGFYYNGKIV